jgi:hypothetical protein
MPRVCAFLRRMPLLSLALTMSHLIAGIYGWRELVDVPIMQPR